MKLLTRLFFQFAVIAFIPVQISVAQKSLKGNTDSLFQVAREYAFNGDRIKARTICYAVLEGHPTYMDVLLLLGRTLAWDKLYDSARVELKKALALKPYYHDAINAIIDLETWSGNYTQTIAYIDHGLEGYPREETWLLKKAELLVKLGREEEAVQVIRTLLELDPLKIEAINLLKSMKKSRKLNTLMLDYEHEYFDQPWIRRWHMTGIGYKRQTKFGSVIGRVNISDVIKLGEYFMSDEGALQFELESYPKVAKKYYMYVAYAYSNDKLFPEQRIGLELFHSFPAHLEGSLGTRFMRFRSSSGGVKDVFIYTASVGYYYRSYWASLRPYLTPKPGGISKSINLEIRRYLKKADNYFILMLGIGNSPDDPSNYSKDYEVYKLSKQKIKLGFKHILINNLLGEINFSYENEEYDPQKFRDNWSGALKLKYQF